MENKIYKFIKDDWFFELKNVSTTLVNQGGIKSCYVTADLIDVANELKIPFKETIPISYATKDMDEVIDFLTFEQLRGCDLIATDSEPYYNYDKIVAIKFHHQSVDEEIAINIDDKIELLDIISELKLHMILEWDDFHLIDMEVKSSLELTFDDGYKKEFNFINKVPANYKLVIRAFKGE